MKWWRIAPTGRSYTQHVPLQDRINDVPLLRRLGDHPRRRPENEYEAQSRFERLCGALYLGFVYQRYYRLKHWGQSPEKKKIAFRKDLRIACLAGGVHFIPISAALVLVILNWHGYYIGSELEGAVGQDDARFLALQFAAKLHELTINASLTAVIFSYIRQELVTDHGLPFGALVAGLQFQNLSYLWSMDFLGAISSSWRDWRHKMALGGLILICAALSVSAGPSSATLMKPRLDYWPAGGTDFWIASPRDELFSTETFPQVPTSCMVDTGDLRCPSAGWRALAENYLSHFQSIQRSNYLPDTVQLSGNKAIRTLRACHRSPDFQFTEDIASASIGCSSVADGLVETGRLWAFAALNSEGRSHERFWSRKNVEYNVQAQQPLVSARCVATYQGSSSANLINRTRALRFYDLWDDGRSSESDDFPVISYDYTENEQVAHLMDNFNTGNVPQFIWTTVPQSNGTKTGLGAVVSLLLSKDMLGLFACTLDARMAPGVLRSTRNAPLVVTGADHRSLYENNNTLPRILITPDWATYLNPTVQADNSSAFQKMLGSAGVWDEESRVNVNEVLYIVESLLCLAVANGLARRDFGTRLSGTLLGNMDGLDLVSNYNGSGRVDVSLDCEAWCNALLPPLHYGMGHGGNAFNVSDSEKTVSTKLTMQAFANGWAYNARGSAAQYSISVLIFYTLIAISHWIWTTLRSKTSSSSWDTTSKLVALALQSDHSESLVNTGAGIDSLEVYEQRTQVIDRNGSLQLAIGVTVGRHNLVKPNEYYG